MTFLRKYKRLCFLEENHDIIVLSFGKSVELSEAQINVIVAFARNVSPTAVLWTLRERHVHMLPEQLPTNLRVETWVNLIGVLSHEHTTLLISQCGVATAHEAILTQTPLLCIPFLYDQFDISVLVKHHHLGDVLAKENMSPASLQSKVLEMNSLKSSYQENAAKLLKLAQLRPSISKVVDWIETVDEIGASYVSPPVELHRVPFYHYCELFLLCGLGIVLVTWLMYTCCCCKCNTKSKQKEE